MQSDQARTVGYLLEKWGVIKGGLVQSFSMAKLTSLLHRHFKEQIAAKQNRLLPVFHYGRDDQTCRRQQLLSYFDEVPAPIIRAVMCVALPLTRLNGRLLT